MSTDPQFSPPPHHCVSARRRSSAVPSLQPPTAILPPLRARYRVHDPLEVHQGSIWATRTRPKSLMEQVWRPRGCSLRSEEQSPHYCCSGPSDSQRRVFPPAVACVDHRNAEWKSQRRCRAETHGSSTRRGGAIPRSLTDWELEGEDLYEVLS